jgi:hypothetical protein
MHPSYFTDLVADLNPAVLFRGVSSQLNLGDYPGVCCGHDPWLECFFFCKEIRDKKRQARVDPSLALNKLTRFSFVFAPFLKPC